VYVSVDRTPRSDQFQRIQLMNLQRPQVPTQSFYPPHFYHPTATSPEMTDAAEETAGEIHTHVEGIRTSGMSML